MDDVRYVTIAILLERNRRHISCPILTKVSHVDVNFVSIHLCTYTLIEVALPPFELRHL